MNHCCYCFDGVWKVKAKYIVLCLNALGKGNISPLSFDGQLPDLQSYALALSIH